MKIFIKYLLILLVGIVVLDFANRALFSYVFSHLPAHSKIRSDFSYVLNEEQSDVLILGSSRASHHYNPQIFIDSLHKTCFNAGQDGQPIYNQYLNLLRAFELGNVDTVILDLCSAQLTDMWINERIKPLTPLYWKNDTARAIVDEISEYGSWTKFLYLSSFIQYSSRAYVLFEYIQPRYTSQEHGYVPIPYSGDKIIMDSDERKELESFRINEIALRYLLKIRDLCQKEGATLYICISPSLVEMDSLADSLTDFCKAEHVNFLNYSSDPRFLNDLTLWKDGLHMNCKGADMYSRDIVDKLNL
jgi:hypothetical protein